MRRTPLCRRPARLPALAVEAGAEVRVGALERAQARVVEAAGVGAKRRVGRSVEAPLLGVIFQPPRHIRRRDEVRGARVGPGVGGGHGSLAIRRSSSQSASASPSSVA